MQALPIINNCCPAVKYIYSFNFRSNYFDIFGNLPTSEKYFISVVCTVTTEYLLLIVKLSVTFNVFSPGSLVLYHLPSLCALEFAGKQWNSKTFRGKAMLLSEISCDVQNNKALPPNLTTVGYIAGEMRLDKTAMVVKYLLYLRYCSKTKKGVFPAIQLTFTPDNWDVEVCILDFYFPQYVCICWTESVMYILPL